MSSHATTDTTAGVVRASRPTTMEAAARARPGRLGYIRAFVVIAVFALMVASAVRYGADLRVDLALAVFWTALVTLVWEVGARALARVRPGSGAGT